MGEVEGIKRNSRQLRGSIRETLQSGTSHFTGGDTALIKYHGIYQQDDRDQRIARMKAKQEEAFMLMVRTKIPGGGLTAEQYLALDRLSDGLANGTLRITTRQDIQFHGVLIGGLRELIQRINAAQVTTFGGCGDVERNVMATAAPFDTPVHREVQRAAKELSDALLPKTRAYFEVWLNGEKIKLESQPEPLDPLYTDAYLPRKFKTAIAIPPDNDVDIYSHDLGLVAHFPNGEVEGYTLLAGGGFGMDHGKVATYPSLAVPLFYVRKEHLLQAAKAVITVHRDYGDRSNRKHARIKYLLAEQGVDWFRQRVQWRMDAPTEPSKPFVLESVADHLGWHAQGDPEGRLFCGLRVECGRIKDYAADAPGRLQGVRYRSGLRALVERFRCPVRFTPNQNILCCNLRVSEQVEFNQVLAAHGIAQAEEYTQAHRMSIACVALPTCHLALSESERVFPPLMEKLDALLQELKLDQEQILFRMTGCPNGCARPYNADFAFVGRGAGKYAVYIGGSHRGDRMAGLAFKSVKIEDLPARLRPFLDEFASRRKPMETFSDYWGRTHANGPAPHPEQFHVELEERKKRLEGRKQSTPTG